MSFLKSDPERRAAIWRQVIDQGWNPEGSASPVVSVAEFFTGNAEEGSIAPNVAGMPGEPTHDVFREILISIAPRPEVQDVLIALDPEDDQDMWPTATTVYILAAASESMVREWTAPLKPDELSEGYSTPLLRQAPELSPGVRVWCLWWD